MASVPLVLLALGAIAIAPPARRAARIDPTIALREEQGEIVARQKVVPDGLSAMISACRR